MMCACSFIAQEPATVREFPAGNSIRLRYAVHGSNLRLAMGMETLNLGFAISPRVIFQEVQLGESLLLDTDTVKYFAFDRLGTRIWLAMQETADADEVLQRVAPESGLSMDQLVRQFRGILAGLEKSGLITLTELSKPRNEAPSGPGSP
jgi:hypothetical protein